LFSFRNHQYKEIDFCKGLNVIWGENGSGKTSILEAIHTLSLGKSFRTHKQKNLIRNGDECFVVKGTFLTKKKTSLIATELQKNGNQRIKIDGDFILSRKDLIGKNNVVVLSPEEQNITKGGPSERRKFFDKLFSVISVDYIDLLQTYNRILKQRNAAIGLIKEKKYSLKEVFSWNEQLTKVAIKLWTLRLAFINDFKLNLKSVLNKFDPTILITVSYLDEVPKEEEYLNQLIKVKRADLRLGRTTIGPHRDTIQFNLKNRNIRNVGSQGEHKICLVLLKLAEMCFMRDQVGQYPILLLDDLFAKLDLERSKKLVGFLHDLETESNEPVQTIVTTTDIIDIKNSGLLSTDKEISTYQLEKLCNT